MAACGSKQTARIHCGHPVLECCEEFTVGTDLMKKNRSTGGIKENCLLSNFKIVKAENLLKNAMNKSIKAIKMKKMGNRHQLLVQQMESMK